MSPYALLRLAWRPLTLVQLSLLIVFPTISAAPFEAAVSAIHAGNAPAEYRLVLWQGLILLPAYVGLLLALFRLELQHTMLSWPLPALRTRLLVGAYAVAVPLALIAAVQMARNSSPSVAFAAFALALLAFVAGWLLYDAAIGWAWRIGVAAVLLAVGFVPAPLARFAESQPWLVFAPALALATWVLSLTITAPLARRRPFMQYFDASGKISFFGELRTSTRRWIRSLATERTGPWLRGAAYESAITFPRSYLVHAAFAVLVAGWLNLPFLLAMFASSWLMSRGLQLHGTIAYPLSRTQRANLSYTGMLVDAVTLMSCIALLLPLATVVPLPNLPFAAFSENANEPASFGTWMLMLAAAFAAAPMAQWAVIRWPLAARRRGYATMQWALVLRMLGYLAAVGSIVWLVRHPAWIGNDLSRSVVLMAGIATVAQLMNWLHLRSYFTKADLVSRRA